jgi:hypothetical protein
MPRTTQALGGYAPTERVFQGHVLDLAAIGGWRAYHTRDSRGSHPGFPDLVLVQEGPDRGPGRPLLLFVELKTRTGRLTMPQEAWLAALRLVQAATGGIVQAHVWRPEHIDTDIPDVLLGRPMRPPPGGDAA